MEYSEDWKIFLFASGLKNFYWRVGKHVLHSPGDVFVSNSPLRFGHHNHLFQEVKCRYEREKSPSNSINQLRLDLPSLFRFACDII